MALFTHEKKQKTESCCCDLKCGACCLTVWLPPQPSRAKGREQWKRGSKIWVGVTVQHTFLCWHTRFPTVSVSQTTVFPLQMTINNWWEFSNKMNISVYSCFSCAWKFCVFWFLVRLPLHRLPFSPCRDRDTGCDCHALRATDHLSLLNQRPHHCTSLAGSLICHPTLHKCAITKIYNRTCRGF